MKDQSQIGASDFFSFIYDGEPEWALSAIKAPIDLVADAFVKFRHPKEQFRNVPLVIAGEQNEEIAHLVSIVQLRGKPWSLIVRSLFFLNEAEFEGVLEDAKELSLRLNTRTLAFASEDKSGAICCRVFQNGKSTSLGFKADASESSAEIDLESGEVNDDGIEQLLQHEEIYLPACYPVTRKVGVSLAILKPSEGKIERADLFDLH